MVRRGRRCRLADIRIVIVDDEPHARKRLRELLDDVPDGSVVGECRDGREALAEIPRLRPDLVFLDVQMPGLDGFGALAEMADPHPLVIFVTAHPEHAVRAFGVEATDYLLKPFDDERFHAALDRVRERRAERRRAALGDRVLGLARDHATTEDGHRAHFDVEEGGRRTRVSTADVLWIEAAGNYVELHLASGTVLRRGTMCALEEELDATRFVRVHRSLIVQRAAVVDVRYLRNHEFALRMADGTTLTSGRSYRSRVEAAFAGDG